MRTKRSLQAEADAVRELRAKRRRQARVHTPGPAPYQLRWAELDRRAMAFTTADGQLDVWTDPDGQVRVMRGRVQTVTQTPCPPSAMVSQSHLYQRHASHYVVFPASSKDEAETKWAAIPSKGDLRLMLQKPTAEHPQWQFTRVLIDALPVHEVSFTRARARARKSWAAAAQAQIPLLPALNFPLR